VTLETAQNHAPTRTLVTVKEIARSLGMSPRWVHERTRRREIPCYRFGATLRFDPEEVRRWQEAFHEGPDGSGRQGG